MSAGTARASTGLGGVQWEALGTGVVLRLTDASALAPAREAVEGQLRAVDLACSRFRDDSELSRLNALDGRAMRAGDVLLDALDVALRAAELTDGDVDPTLGRALELAGYDRDWRELPPPLDDPREAPAPPHPVSIVARVRPGWRGIVLDRARGLVRLPAGVLLDLGATAKAWAADRAAAAAAERAGCGVLLGIGGDFATAGRAPAGGWEIHVTDDHRSDCSAPGQTVAIVSGGLATSSTAVRRWSHAGRTMHHVIDPATGMPARERWRTVSVAAASCTDANIAATAALVRGTPAAAWLEHERLPARLVDRCGEVRTLAGWPADPQEGRWAA